MKPILLALAVTLLAHAADTLIVADEFPAMQNLAKKLKGPADIIAQDKLPADLSKYKAVVVYIHESITPASEHAFIKYTDAGGRLVLLHHSISSKKRENADWLPWLGVTLPTGPYEKGGYKYIDPCDFEMFNAAGQKIEFPDTEIYLNHVLSGPRVTLWSIRYNGVEQPTGAWYRPSGKGSVYYFMAGHKGTDFDRPLYGEAVAAAIEGRLKHGQ